MDERLVNIEKQKQEALNQSKNVYQGLMNDNQNLYNQQQNYANQQEQIQNNMLDQKWNLTKQQIEKQKNDANQNFQDERKRARNEYTSFINPYGVNAEHQASQGLLNSGYSETTKLGGFNAYQNRLANANKVMQDAITEYDLSMNEARTNYDVQKAQYALEKLKLQLGYSQDFYNNKSNLAQQQLSNNQMLDNNYFNRYQSEYENIQTEKAREEQIRQYNEQFAYQKERDKISDKQWQQQYALSQQKTYSSGSSNSSNNGSSPYQLRDGNNNGASETKIENTSNNYFVEDGTQYQSTYSPRLSNGEAQAWLANELGTKAFTRTEIVEKLSQGISNEIINEEDKRKIAKSFGI